MPYGPQWRSIRKHSHALLNLSASVKYEPVQDFESKQLLWDFLREPEQFYEMNRRYSASVIMRVAYGYRIPGWDDPLVCLISFILYCVELVCVEGWRC